uniref:Uncharacterized protein n=1 Tax=Equus caballus TaxID=9796 RepID=A0A3Q2IEI0_HORSE
MGASPPVHSCVFSVVGSSSCGMWDAASAWSDEQCHVRAQDSNRRNTGPPAAERENLTTRPRGQPKLTLILIRSQNLKVSFNCAGSGGAAQRDCEGLCWNLAARRLGEQPHAGSYSAGQFSSSFGSFTQPCTQWLHKADYKLQRIPEGAKSDAGANEPREPLIPVTEWDKLGKAWTTQIQAHQAAESLPWEPGVIIRPIQRGPGTLGAREAGRAGAAAPARARGGGDPAGPCGRPGALGGGLCVCSGSASETRAPTGPCQHQ